MSEVYLNGKFVGKVEDPNEFVKKYIEDRIGQPVKHFSYPNGGNYAYYNESVIEMVRKAGFLT